MYVDNDGIEVPVVYYGELQLILVCTLPDNPIFQNYAGNTFLLAIVTPCKTQCKDAREELTCYKDVHTKLAVDVRSITAVVGRVKTRQKWYIVDQFDAAIPTFDELNEKNGNEIEGRDSDDDE